jgi:uncharacterized repeat protein (TIGR01451 family)
MHKMNLRVLFASAVLGVLTTIGSSIDAAVITDFSPTAGAPGDRVLLTGSGFGPGTIVRFWNGGSGVVATNVFVNSVTLMTVYVPYGITTGPISVGSQYTANDFLAIGKGPYISDFSPGFGAVNDTVVIHGAHLANTNGIPVIVKFHGTNATEVNPNDNGTQITTRVPVGATSGFITVTTTSGTSNSPSAFTFVGPGPFISGFSPISGPGGTLVLIGGLHLAGVTNVTFNGLPGSIQKTNSDSVIEVLAPSGNTSGPIAVYSPNGSSVTTSNFFGMPSISSISPTFGRANTNVLVKGANFKGATAVRFNGLASTSFVVSNNTTLSASVPAGATTGLIRVIVPGASAFSETNFVVRPTLSGFSPPFGPVGSSVTITGANLNVGTPTVRFNGVAAAAPTGVSFGQLTAKVPAGASTGFISVSTADGSDTNATRFFLPAAITGFAPTNSGPGSRIRITGQNFVGASAVNFNGTPAEGFTVTNNGSIGATVPSGVVTGPISVTTPAGTASSGGLFYGAPLISDFTPTHGLPGTSVEINGVNFLGGSVQFNGLNATISSLNNTQIVAIVPGAATTGPITVIGPAGTNTSVAKFVLDYTSDLSVWFTNSPNPVTIGSNLVYTISIVNTGPFPTPNATLTNTLPDSVTLRSATISPPWILATNGNLLTGSASSLSVGSATTFTISVTPHLTGYVTDTISVSSDSPDPHPEDNLASITTRVEPLALLSIKLLTNQVKLTWPAFLTNYALQFQDRFSTNPLWSALTNAPAITGGLESVIDTNTGATRFYRLKK